MKLIIGGATGFVGTELVRQALRLPIFTEVVALSRKGISAPLNAYPNSDVSKLRSVIVEDYDKYPKDVLDKLAGADACIWTVAITPIKSRAYSTAEVRRVTVTSAEEGLSAIFAVRGQKSAPLRYCGMSGWAVDRDPNKKRWLMADYAKIRADAENVVLHFAAEHKGQVEVTIARPGLILADDGWISSFRAGALSRTVGLPSIGLAELSAALLDQCINGITDDPLLHHQLVDIGHRAFMHAQASS